MTAGVNVIDHNGQPVLVAIPRGGRARISEDADGRWLTVRTWWGRAVRRMPIAPLGQIVED